MSFKLRGKTFQKASQNLLFAFKLFDVRVCVCVCVDIHATAKCVCGIINSCLSGPRAAPLLFIWMIRR